MAVFSACLRLHIVRSCLRFIPGNIRNGRDVILVRIGFIRRLFAFAVMLRFFNVLSDRNDRTFIKCIIIVSRVRRYIRRSFRILILCPALFRQDGTLIRDAVLIIVNTVTHLRVVTVIIVFNIRKINPVVDYHSLKL